MKSFKKTVKGIFCLAVLCFQTTFSMASERNSSENKLDHNNLSVEFVEIQVPAAHKELLYRSHLKNVYYSHQKSSQIQPEVDLDKIISIGEKLWLLISGMGGELKLTSMTGVAAIPEGAQTIGNMAGWKMANPKAYQVKIKGLIGTAFSFSYTVGFSYGGSYNGKGHYLANVAIVPHQAKCGTGWKCDVEAHVGTPINVGTSASPIAALPVNLLINAKGKVNSKAAGAQITVFGDGRIVKTGE